MSQKQTVLITGCSDGGLGAALANEFHAKGYRVFATARDVSKMSSLATEIEKLALEVTSETSIQDCLAEIKLRTSTLNILVNNAGVWHTMPFSDVDVQAARATFDINFWGPIVTTQAFLPLLLAARKQDQKATVVFASSLAGGNPTPFSSIYGSSKAAAEHVFDVLGLELSPWNINTVSLKTGAVESNMTKNQRETGLQKPQLPPNSLYAAAKDKVELFMSGKSAKAGTNAAEWAKMVVKELEKPTPPKYIWGGEYSFAGWMMQYLPSSLFRGMLFQVTGLDAVTKSVKEQHSQ